MAGTLEKFEHDPVTIHGRVRKQVLITINELAAFRSYITTAVCSSLGGVGKLHRLQKRRRGNLG